MAAVVWQRANALSTNIRKIKGYKVLFTKVHGKIANWPSKLHLRKWKRHQIENTLRGEIGHVSTRQVAIFETILPKGNYNSVWLCGHPKLGLSQRHKAEITIILKWC